MIKQIIRMGDIDVTRYINDISISYSSIEDKIENINSFEPIENVYRSGGANGTFKVRRTKEKQFLSLILGEYNGNTKDADYVQFPMVITGYDSKTKEIVSTEVFVGTKCIREGGQEQETKKNEQYYTYTWTAADNFIDTTGNYVYTDKLTYAETGVSLSQEVAKPEDVFVVYVKDNMEKVLEHEYDVAVSGESCTIEFNDSVDLKAGDKVVVTYLTTSTNIL